MSEEKITKEEIEKVKEKLKEKIEKRDTEETKQVKEEESEKKEKKERIGILHIYTTFNNTIINLTDLAGTSIAKFSGGGSTKQSRLKANPTVAMFVAQKIAEEAKDNGFTGFYVKIRAGTGQPNPGPGAHSAIKSLTRAGFKILSIMDNTRIARGGPKQGGGRRGRRV
jgi:small subunit ribosomal protein S11